MIPRHNPHPSTRAEVAATIKGYKKQIKHFEERIAETRERIHGLQGQTTLLEASE